jgi:hypothetical protein
MDRFIRLSVEPGKNHTALHLDQYIAETLDAFDYCPGRQVPAKRRLSGLCTCGGKCHAHLAKRCGPEEQAMF